MAHTPYTLARTAFEATGASPDSQPTHDAVDAAVQYAVTSTLEELADLTRADVEMVLESILRIIDYRPKSNPTR